MAGAEAGPTEHGFGGVIVALGASAGGLDALDRFFASLPPLDSTAFVVIQHLAPEHKTMMDTLLARHTKMQVTVAVDGVVLEGGHVYVIPPGTTMTVTDSRLRLVPRPTTGVTLPIDAFFESLASEAPTRSIGVVLSGTGSDGTRGVAALDEAGAWVMAQDPETAKFDGMPLNAIASGAVDHVLSPESLAAEVAALVASGAGPPERPPGARLAIDEYSIEQVLRMLAGTMRIDFSQYKPNTVLRRVERRMQATGSETISAYRDRLVGDPDEVDTLRRELLIPVTRFFRDPEAFEALGEALTELVLARRGDADRTLRVWVTPCSTGEEAYSVAMLLLDLASQHAPGLEIKVFATDVEAQYVEHAAAGVYTDAQIANVPDGFRSRWFEEIEPGTWRCRQSLRTHIVFTRHDLLVDAPFTQIDLVTCRNLLIYLRPAAQDRAIRRLSYALRSGGILFLGTSENPGAASDGYAVIDARQKLYRLVRRAPSLPPGDLVSDAFGHHQPTRRRAPDPARADRDAPLDRALDDLIRTYAPPSMIVTSDRRLVHTFGDTRDLLRFGGGDVTLDVVKLLPDTLAPVVATLVHGAVRDGAAHRSRPIPVRLDDDAGGERHAEYSVAVRPIIGDGDGERVQHLIVSFETPPDTEVVDDAEPSDVVSMGDRHVSDLERELALTRANLHDTIQDLGTANEELQATNEELMAANEELQSTNEELQSVNEELHTVNAEFQSKIAEINELYADLESLTRATRIPLVFLDADLRLTRFTPAATALFRFRAADVGRHITDFSHSLDYPDLYEVAGQVAEHGAGDPSSIQREVSDQEGRSWLVTVLSYAPHSTQTTRIVITCVDVSYMRDVRQLQSTLDALPEHVAVLEPDGEIAMVNRSWREFAQRNGIDGHHRAGPGANYLEACRAGSDDDPAIAHIVQGITGVLAGELPGFSVRYPCHSPTEQRWFLLHATPLEEGGCVVTHFDVTDVLGSDDLGRGATT